MSNGGYKGATPPRETSPEHYPGVWGLPEQFQAQADGNWPFQKDDCAPKSLRFDGSNNYLSRTPSSVSNRRTFTWSGWVKRGKLGEGGSYYPRLFATARTTDKFEFNFMNDDTLRLELSVGAVVTTRVFRDPSSFYHIVLAVDTTEGSNSDRVKMYVNGERVTSFSSYPSISQNFQTGVNTTQSHAIGRYEHNSSDYFDGCLSEIFFIDGQALSCDEFGFFDGQGIWQPKRFTGDYSSGPVYSNAVPTADGFRPNRIPSHGFDGDLSTYIALNNTTFNLDVGSWGLSGTLEVYTGGSHQYAVNGGSPSNMTASGWTNVGDASSITTLTLTRTDSNYPYFNAIRLQGVVLIDALVGANSFHLDFSDISDANGPGKDSSGLGNHFPVLVTGSGPYEGLRVAGPQQPWDSGTAIAITSGDNHNTSGNQRGLRFDSELLGTHTLTLTKVSGSHNMDFWASSSPTTQGSRVTNSSNTIVISSDTSSRSPSYTGRYLSIEGSGGGYVTFSVSGTANSASTQLSNVLVDVPVNGTEASTGVGNERRGNYCCMNSLDHNGCTFSNGNLTITPSSSNCGRGTVWATSGKWYFEFDMTAYGNPYVGIASTGHLQHYVSQNSIAINNTGTIYVSTGGAQTYPGKSIQIDAVGSYMCAFDLDNGKIWWGKNGTWYQLDSSTSNQTTTLSDVEAGNGAVDFSSHPNFGKEWTVQCGTSSNSSTFTVNTGQSTFKYPSSIPAGFSPLATSFLPEPTIKRGDEFMEAVLWAATNSTQPLTGLRFAPGLVWSKSRSTTWDNGIHDIVRGPNKLLRANTASAEFEAAAPNFSITSFNSDGVTFGPDGAAATVNYTGTYVGWAWAAGDATTSIAAGGLNSSAYDQSQTWSSSLTSSNGFWSGQPATNAFDGDPGNNVTGTNNGGTLTFAPSNYTIPANSTIEIRCSGQSGSGYTVVVNGVSNDIGSGTTDAAKFHTVNYDGGTSLSVTVTSKSNYSGDLRGIRVNGKLLVDSGVSVANVPLVASTVRAQTEAGFSISKWTKSGNGHSYAHGLSKPPELVIAKSLAGGHSWRFWHKDLGSNTNMLLDQNDGQDTYTDMIGIPGFFDVPLIGGGPGATNGGMIAYNFHSVEGYSQISSYTSSSGQIKFVHLDFAPKFLLIKRVVHTGDKSYEGFVIFDSVRSPSNINGKSLYANENHSEGKRGQGSAGHASFGVDLLSNGFCFKDNSTEYNRADNGLYVFYAVAEHPFASQARAR